MATVTARKDTDNTVPPLKFSLDISGSYNSDAWSSGLVETDDEEMTAEAVLKALEDEYGLSTTAGAIDFLYNQSWFGQMEDLEIIIAIEDREEDK